MQVFLASLMGRKLVYIVAGIIFDILSKKYGWGAPDFTGLLSGGTMAGTTAFEDFAKHLADKEASKERTALKKK